MGYRTWNAFRGMASLLAVLLCYGCNEPDKVEVTELVSSHATPIPGTGTVVTVRIKVHNKTADDLRHVMVDVNIPNVAPLASLYRDFVDIPGGGFVEREYSFVAKVGLDIVTGCVDPENALGEQPEGIPNNCRSIDLTLYETQELDYRHASHSGATFDDGRDAIGTCVRLGQGDARWMRDYGNGQTGVVFVADCPSYGSFFGALIGSGGRANPAAFGNFRLKNGWKVDSIQQNFRINREDANDVHGTLDEAFSSAGGGNRDMDFAFTTPPAIGSDNPFMQAHVWANVGGFLVAYTKIIIKGPNGTDPYGPVTSMCGSGARDASFMCATNSDCASGYTCISGCCM